MYEAHVARSFLTLIGLQVQSAVDNRIEEYRGAYEANVARKQVSPPTHSSTLHQCSSPSAVNPTGCILCILR